MAYTSTPSTPSSSTSSLVKEASSSDINPTNLSYNTVSCPCSSYAIDLDNGNIGCERDHFGTIKSVKPVSIKNHLIENKRPKVGDKWLCTNFKCEQDDFKWDTFHVVKVEEDSTESSSSLFNSKTSTLNCHIPKISTLKELYRADGISKFPSNFEHKDPSSPDINDFASLVNEKPLYKTKEQAMYKNLADNNNASFIEYNKNGLSGFLPGKIVGDEKLITGVIINGVSITKWNKDAFSPLSELEDDDTNLSKAVFHKNGGEFRIKINGINNPVFTFSLKDRSGCDILRNKHKNVICKGKYDISQMIPPLPSGVVSETYDFTMSLAADTNYWLDLQAVTSGTINIKIYQYRDATYTFTVTPSTLSSASTSRSAGGSASTDSVFSGSTSSKTHTTRITHAGRNLYVKNPIPAFNEVVVKSNVIKRFVIKDDNSDTSETNNIKVVARPEHNASDVAVFQGDLKKGMIFNSSITKTKTVRKSIDLDIHKEPCDDCPERDVFTNKFEIDNTNDIFEGMAVKGKDSSGAELVAYLESVDCGKSITLTSSHIIDRDTDLTFNYVASGHIIKIEDCSDGELLSLDTQVQLPNGSEIKFENSNISSINGIIRNDKNGAKNIIVTTTIYEIEYGQEDVTFTLDINDLVTFKPNNRDQYLIFGKNSTANSIDFVRNGVDARKYDYTVTINKQPSNGTLSVASGVYTYAPNQNFTGKDKIYFILVDPNGDDPQSSDEKTIFITVK